LDISPVELVKKTEHDIEPSDYIDLIRAQDVIFGNLLAFYVIFSATFQDIEMSIFPYLSSLPLFCIAYTTMKLPANFDIEGWQSIVFKLRLFSAIAAFSFPFFIFVHISSSAYFMTCTLIGLFSFYKFLAVSTKMSSLLSLKYDDPSLAQEGRTTGFMLYVSALLVVVYLALSLKQDMFIIEQVGVAARVAWLILIVFPLLLPLTVMFRVRLLVVQNYKEKMRSL
jgi:hypothetical protein